ncbi:hypothetical protein AB0C11_41695 [Streptomyces sp. NPDC039016]|uniref:hypothetical protein n=1 Tax=Streptomyces sp. NPDC039016 TaxID=3154330 RepID=UPI0033E6DA2E
MARANAARDRLTGHDEVGGLLACPEVRRANYAAGVHLRTGHPRTALQEAQAALAQPPHAHGTTAQLHVSTACAHLALGEPDAAIVALQPALDLPQEHRMAPVTSRLRELAAATTGTPLANSRAAYELRGRIDAFCDAAPRHALSPADPVS